MRIAVIKPERSQWRGKRRARPETSGLTTGRSKRRPRLNETLDHAAASMREEIVEFVHRKRLGEVIVKPCRQRARFVRLRRVTGQRDQHHVRESDVRSDRARAFASVPSG